MKKIVILSGSPRINGNSSLLCNEFARGAEEAGHNVEKINVARKKVSGCLGCNYCTRNNGECIQKDDMEEIRKKMIDADIIVLASPIYYYCMSSQLKAVIDRCFAFGDELSGKSFYYLISCAAPSEEYTETMIASLNGFTCCIPNSKECGTVIACGMENVGDIKDTVYLTQAYEMGKSIK